MPLVRFELRNEYGMGDPELFRDQGKREEPKALLEGVAVAGLVGILRQLGDLAEFAAEIFHDLHEQVTATASRGRKMTTRMRHIEESLSSIEKSVHDQKSHIHLAYTPGCAWRSNIQAEREHLRHSDLPYFIMDSYEGCRDPPNLFMLDKFDSSGAGSGACLRRYSDPSFFKRAASTSETVKMQKIQKAKKDHRGKVMHFYRSKLSRSKDGGYASRPDRQCAEMTDLGSRSTSFSSRARTSFIEEPVSDITFSKENEAVEEEEEEEEEEDDALSSGSVLKDSRIEDEHPDCDDDYYDDYLQAQDAMGSVHATWHEHEEIVKPKPRSRAIVNSTMNVDYPMASEPSLSSDHPPPDGIKDVKDINDLESVTPSASIMWDEKQEIVSPPIKHDDAEKSTTQESEKKETRRLEEATSETDNYVDAVNTLDSETETEPEVQTKGKLSPPLKSPPSDASREAEEENGCACSKEAYDLSHLSKDSGQKASDEPVRFWTNGGLLGLQPSKPPDFGVKNVSFLMKSELAFKDDAEAALEKDRSTWQEQSSPPLEHMKMSFCPMNGLDANKLKLEFPGGHLHESVEELMFPSFQLLPLPGSCSESEGDAFCRSCPYSSEDSRSQQSESDSELWAQDETSGSEHREMHGDEGSRAFSSSPAAASPGFAFQSSEPLDLPSMDALESEKGSDVDSSLSRRPVDFVPSSSSVSPPAPPPLPPAQWRAMRPGGDEPLLSSRDNKMNEVEVRETEDYLQQIRTKSFQLRPTATSKAQAQQRPGPAANFKVAAILEKAIAIRQACAGSDEGADDEAWSDS